MIGKFSFLFMFIGAIIITGICVFNFKLLDVVRLSFQQLPTGGGVAVMHPSTSEGIVQSIIQSLVILEITSLVAAIIGVLLLLVSILLWKTGKRQRGMCKLAVMLALLSLVNLQGIMTGSQYSSSFDWSFTIGLMSPWIYIIGFIFAYTSSITAIKTPDRNR